MKLLGKYWDFIFIVLISSLPLISLLHPGLPVTHDGQDHVARIANFYQSLSEGIIIPRWAGNLNWGFGHPILMFLYPLPSYAASIFHFLGFGLVDSVKLVFAISFILSGICMYMWGKLAFGKIAGLVAAILYLFAPYRFVDLYVRGAIGEHVAFVFPPLICYFLLKLSNNKKFSVTYFIGAVLSLAGLILSHNALLIMFLPFILFYGIYLIIINEKKSQLIYQYIGAFVLGFALSAFFLVPAFLEGKYTLRDIVTGDEALKRFVSFTDLFYGPWSYGGTGDFTVQIGILQWLFIILTPFGLYTLYKNKKNILLYLGTFIYFLGSIFIMLPESKFIWETITILQKFQFPWRFLSASIFATAILSGIFIASLKKQNIKFALLVVVVVLCLLFTYKEWYPKGYLLKDESFYTSVYEGTTDTGESAPIWSIRFMEHKPKAPMEVIEGSAKIKELSRTTTKHSYNINSQDSSRIVENTLYFPGWKIYVDGKEYKGIQFQDPNYRGLMTFKVLNGEHKIDIVFRETKLRTISDIISALALGFLVLLIVVNFTKSKKK